MSSENLITRENMDTYLTAIAKQYRKLVKKAMPAEITLVGGASILINYGFRDSTYDIDAVIRNAFQELIHVCGIKTVGTVLRTVEAEPVCTGQPYFIAVLVIQTAALGMEPVVVAVIDCRNAVQSGREVCAQHSRRAECEGCRQTKRQHALVFH